MRTTGYPSAVRAKSLSGWREAALLLLAWSWAGVSNGAPVEYAWRDEFRYFYSGVAYWGEMATSQMPTGTEFLKGEYVWASLHTDKDLELAACEWIESFGVHVTIVSPTTLDHLLRAGHERLIVSAPWRKKPRPFVDTRGKLERPG